MKPLKPSPPFSWPEPRVFEKMGFYDESIEGKRNNLVADIKAMYLELVGMGEVSEGMINEVIADLGID